MILLSLVLWRLLWRSLRRSLGRASAELSVAGLRLDEETQRVILDDGREVELTGTEFRLLRYLMSYPDHVLSKSRLTEHVYEGDHDRDSNVLEVYIRGLLLALVTTFGLLFWAAVAAVASLSEAYVMTRLEHDAEALLGAVRVAPGGRHRLREGRITHPFQPRKPEPRTFAGPIGITLGHEQG